MATLQGRWLGRRPFEPCLALQVQLREAIIAAEGPETLLMVEHPPTLTLGRLAEREDILWTDEELEAEEVVVCEAPRGGDVTLHAPGQLVAYPVVRIGRKVREHVMTMAEATMALLGELGVDDLRYVDAHPGVWRGETKIASVGIHVRRGVAIQGMSINLDVAPRLFGALVSCGLPEVEMISASTIRRDPLPAIDELARRWAELFAERAGCTLCWGSDS